MKQDGEPAVSAVPENKIADMDIEELYTVFLASEGVNTDTRTLRPGQLFFALKGENFDGNAYAFPALDAGASYAVVNEYVVEDDPRLIKVPDTLQTLKELAAFHRRSLSIPVVGLTGTNGKTTTKELIRSVLACRYRVTATQGNLNNDIGVPLSILSVGKDTEIAVIEMGANHPDDISALTWVSQPDCGLITNVGKAHLLGFGSFEGVKRAKGQLYDYLAAHGGKAFVNTGDPDLTEMASGRGLEIVPYGLDADNAAILPSSSQNPFLRMTVGGQLLETRLVGAYNAVNVLAALCVGRFFGVPQEDALAAISAYTPSNNRSQMSRTEHNVLIEDAYNANPSSMAAALDNFAMLQDPHKVALLGDMRELGVESVREHMEVIRHLDRCGLEKACLVGEEFRKAIIEVGTRPYLMHFPDSGSLADYLAEHPLRGATVLVKGSRSMRMERVIASL